MKHDLWFDLTDRAGNPDSGRIRLMLQWTYSKNRLFFEYLRIYDAILMEDIDNKEQIEKTIKYLEKPF
jgi:hypothetical protein